ncbi:hypothetical protein DPMN_140020 [Dreissena polymorpha]|uniref:Uncharacterized protein n=1 Tax=Dreissena polymorpha TaxID=45954 RepID=A0A9D4JIM3_DREPO|nr:hypothetical protein DPMN_140020 [Dreissena polymorpha]
MTELLRLKEELKSDANATAASGHILHSPPPLSTSANRIRVRSCTESSFAI